MHGILKEFLIILSEFPLVFFHQLAVLIKRIGIIVLRVAVEEFTSLTFRLFHDFGRKLTRQFTGFAQQHIPNIVGYHAPTFLAFLHSHHVHHGQVLYILAERGYQRRVTYTRPYVSHFVEEFNQQFVLLHKRQVTFSLILVDRFQIGLQVRHQAAHHAARKSRTNQQRVHQTVLRADVQAEEIIHKLLYQGANLHVGFHIDLRYLETGVFQHGLHAKQVGMSGTP